jgi:hypothetical protein
MRPECQKRGTDSPLPKAVLGDRVPAGTSSDQLPSLHQKESRKTVPRDPSLQHPHSLPHAQYRGPRSVC